MLDTKRGLSFEEVGYAWLIFLTQFEKFTELKIVILIIVSKKFFLQNYRKNWGIERNWVPIRHEIRTSMLVRSFESRWCDSVPSSVEKEKNVLVVAMVLSKLGHIKCQSFVVEYRNTSP